MVVETLTQDYDNFKAKASEMPEELLEETVRRHGLRSWMLPGSSEISYEEIEKTLENADPRSDHQRAQDAVVQKGIELYGDRSYDIILTNVAFDVSEYAETDDFGNKDHEDRMYRTEFDVMFLDTDQRSFRGVEAKPRRGKPVDPEGNTIHEAPAHAEKARRQFEVRAFITDLCREQIPGFDWSYKGGDVIYETDLSPANEIPDGHEGSFYAEDGAKQKAVRSGSLNSLIEPAESSTVDLREGARIDVEKKGFDPRKLF